MTTSPHAGRPASEDAGGGDAPGHDAARPAPVNSTRRASRPPARRRLLAWLFGLPLALAARIRPREIARGEGAPWHHLKGGFRNPPGSPERHRDLGDWAEFFQRRLLTRPPAPEIPDRHVLPETAALEALERAGGRDSLTWLGHATFLVRLNGATVLTDPFLDDYASPLPPFGPKRFARAGIAPERLPPVDLLLVSHNHYEHLDRRALDRLRRRSATTAVVPLRLGRHLRGLGFGRVIEVDWHDRVELSGLVVTALPAIHFSGRGLLDRNRTLWTGYAVEGGGRRLYFAGDTAMGPVFHDLGRQYGPFDLALLPIGAYEPRPLLRAVHASPEEAVRLARALLARRLVGMHWGTIRLTDEPPFEPPLRFRAAARAAGYDDDHAWLMAIGETRAL